MSDNTLSCKAPAAFSLAISLMLFSCGGDKSAVLVPPPQPYPTTEGVEQSVQTAQAEPSSKEAYYPPVQRKPRVEEQSVLEVTEEAAAAAQDLPEAVRAVEFEAMRRALAINQQEASDLPALSEDEEETTGEPALIEELSQAAIPDDVDLSENREERFGRTDSELPLVLNDDVKKMVNYFTVGGGKKTMLLTMGRANEFREMIERILREEGVPLELIHLCQAETGFRTKARSWASATGLWQFMAFRGQQYGLRQDRYVEERYDPEKATRAAARHLKDLYIEFGDWYLAMAAYNSGPLRVQRAIQRGNTRDYWEMRRRQLLPRETRNYIPIILAMTYVAKNLDMYDIGTIDPAPPLRYDTVEVDVETSLALIADLAGTTETTVKDLNPALLRSATPPYDYALRLPVGAAENFERELALIPAEKRMDWRRHEVGDGDTLAAIAKRYNVDPTTLIAHNDLPNEALSEHVIEPGMRLTIPTTTRVESYRGAPGGGAAGGLLEGGTGRYKVARGDTLGGISSRFSVTVAQLRQWNGLSSTRIRAGRYLIVRPNGAATTTASSSGAPTSTYKIARGDTLGAIARRFGVSVTELKSWNGLSNNLIHVGGTLRVPSLGGGSSDAPAQAESETETAGYVPPSENSPAGAGQYRVRNGDNLGAIADRFGVSVTELKAWNNLRSSRIRAGNFLTVRPPSSKSRTPALARSTGPAPSASAPSPTPNGAVRYEIRPGDNLHTIAGRHSVEVRDLMAWNGLRNASIHPGQFLTIRNQPETQAAVAASSSPGVSSAAKAAGGAEIEYQIRNGDNLGAIADRHSVSVEDLKAWNGLRGTRISAGDKLVIKNQRAGGSPPAAATKPAAVPEQTPTRAALAPAPAPAPAPAAQSGASEYTVRSGDTLGAIAERFSVSVTELRQWNGLPGTRITVGDKLNLRPVSLAKITEDGAQYRIQRGDTLATIAARFSVTVDQLKAWNGLSSTRITAGDLLLVHPPSGRGVNTAASGGL